MLILLNTIHYSCFLVWNLRVFILSINFKFWNSTSVKSSLLPLLGNDSPPFVFLYLYFFYHFPCILIFNVFCKSRDFYLTVSSSGPTCTFSTFAFLPHSIGPQLWRHLVTCFLNKCVIEWYNVCYGAINF